MATLSVLRIEKDEIKEKRERHPKADRKKTKELGVKRLKKKIANYAETEFRLEHAYRLACRY